VFICKKVAVFRVTIGTLFTMAGLDNVLSLVVNLLQNQDDWGGLAVGDLIPFLSRRAGESIFRSCRSCCKDSPSSGFVWHKVSAVGADDGVLCTPHENKLR
jgi:hypothetical protein